MCTNGNKIRACPMVIPILQSCGRYAVFILKFIHRLSIIYILEQPLHQDEFFLCFTENNRTGFNSAGADAGLQGIVHIPTTCYKF